MIGLLLKCKCTKGKEVELFVRERFDDEDILVWMDFVQKQVGAWHRQQQCSATNLEYMKIPVADGPDATIGQRR